MMGKCVTEAAEDVGCSVRDSFFYRIYDLIQAGADIVVVTPDLGAPSLDALREHYPERFVSVGIAEQELISVAAGLVLAGKNVIAYGLGPFPVTRAYDQIRCLLSEMDIPVTVCTLNAGLCSAECGYTHAPIDDMGMVRALPHLRVYNPTDVTISQKLANETCTNKHPRIIRFDKYLRGTLYMGEELDVPKGFAEYGVSGGLAVVTYGHLVPEIRGIADELLQGGKRIKVIDAFALPADEEKLAAALSECGSILTVEEHVLTSGLGTYLLELLSDRHLTIPVRRMGLHFSDGYYDVFADRAYIRRDQGLDRESVSGVITTMLHGLEVRP